MNGVSQMKLKLLCAALAGTMVLASCETTGGYGGGPARTQLSQCMRNALVGAGIGALAPDTAGVFIFLGDMPLVPVALCDELAALAQDAGYAARPVVSGKPGHPAAFTRAAFADLAGLRGDAGGNRLLAGRASGVVYRATDDAGALIDIDAPGDLAAAEAAWKVRATSVTSDSAISRGAFPKPGSPSGA